MAFYKHSYDFHKHVFRFFIKENFYDKRNYRYLSNTLSNVRVHIEYDKIHSLYPDNIYVHEHLYKVYRKFLFEKKISFYDFKLYSHFFTVLDFVSHNFNRHV